MEDIVLLFIFRVRWRDESARRGRGRDVMNSPKEQHWTSDRNVMRYKGFPAHIKQMISA